MAPYFYALLLTLLTFSSQAQVTTHSLPKKTNKLTLDTPSSHVKLKEVTLYSRPVFESAEVRKSYLILSYMVHRVYPFARMASERLEEINSRITKIRIKSKKRKYLKRLQKFMESEFSDKLKKYTIWEGQILIKLIHRQTGITCYNLIKSLRSGFRAFFYNATASFFDLTLRSEYHPEYYYKDFLVEKILMQSFSDGTLEAQDSKLYIEDYSKLTNLWAKRKKTIVIKYFDVRSNDEKKVEDDDSNGAYK